MQNRQTPPSVFMIYNIIILCTHSLETVGGEKKNNNNNKNK